MADTTGATLEAFGALASSLDATLAVVLTDRADVAAEALKRSPVPVVVATSSRETADEAGGGARRTVELSHPIAGGVGVFPQLKEILLGLYLEGTLRPTERVVALASTGDSVTALAFFDVARDLELGHLRSEIEGRVPMRVMERVLRLASELAREGREGKPVGTLFVVGDVGRVLERSRQAVLNPFQGHPAPARNILDDVVWETVKEFAQLDGAFVLGEDGTVEAAGRYVTLEDDGEVQPGLGGRHIAAAGVTRQTRAIAVAVSSNGAIRVFKGGRVVMMVGKL